MDWKGNLEVAEKVKENLIREGWPVCGAAVPSGKRYSSMVALWEERLRQPQVLGACFILCFILEGVTLLQQCNSALPPPPILLLCGFSG